MLSRQLKQLVSGELSFCLPRSCSIMTDGVERTMQYLLGDAIYPDWPLFINPIKNLTKVNERRIRSNQKWRGRPSKYGQVLLKDCYRYDDRR